MKTRREFLRDATLAGAAGALLLGGASAFPFAREAGAQTTTPAAPGWLEDRDPAARTFSYGLPINPYEVGGEAGIRAVLDRAKEAAADEVAVGVFWPTVEDREGGPLYLGPVDYALQEARARGMTVSLYVAGTPDWVHPDLRNTVSDALIRQTYAPIRNDAEVARYERHLSGLVDRYGTRVLRYVIWNEPNNPHAFGGYARTASAAPYARLLRIAYRAIKARNPEATVTFGGLSVNDEQWFQWFYEAMKRYGDAAANRFFFDEMDCHVYTQGNSHEYAGFVDDARAVGIRRIPSMKAVMDRNGDTGKKIRVGESGFTTERNGYFQAVPDDRRALFLKQVYSRAREDFPYVAGLTWFTFHVAPNSPASWAILDANLAPRRTFRAFQEATGWHPALKVYPKIPTGPVSGRWKVEPVWEGGPAPADVYRWEVYVNGLLVEESAAAPLEVEAWNVKNAKQEVVLAAYTRDGSVYSARPIVVDFRSYVPRIYNVSPPPGSTVSGPAPLVSAYVRDGETNLQKSNMKVIVDGANVTSFNYDPNTDRLAFNRTMGRGSHKVRIEARDSGDNLGKYEWSFNVR